MKTQGLVDIQINGFFGVDFNSTRIDGDGLRAAMEAMLATGVTCCLPTFITASAADLKARMMAFDRLAREDALVRAMCPGFHLEGPFLSPRVGYAGCHPAAVMTPPDIALIDALQVELSLPILMVTLAAEYEQSAPFIKALKDRHIIAAIGHSAANFEDVARAVAAGASLSTHLGNALPSLPHKFHNPLMVQLGNDGLYASFIADGLHIPPFALQSLIRAKGVSRSILVTDAVCAAQMPVGTYQFADMVIERGEDGRVTSGAQKGLAGSALTLDKAVANLVQWGIASFEEAVDMASKHALDILQPALVARNISLPLSDLEWREDLTIKRVRLGAFERSY